MAFAREDSRMDGDELKRRLGQRLQFLREAKGLTQEQLAERVGRSVDTVSNIERGKNFTRPDVAYALAKELGVHLAELFEVGNGQGRGNHERKAEVEAIVALLEKQDVAVIRQVKDLVHIALKLASNRS